MPFNFSSRVVAAFAFRGKRLEIPHDVNPQVAAIIEAVIRTKCLKLAGIVQNIEYAKPSGLNEQDKLNMAIAAWTNEEKEKGGFKLLHCYNVLKSSPKWITEVIHPT
ncbi:hypothetical protein AKJ16_DCAP21872 [Drosera capensis]